MSMVKRFAPPNRLAHFVNTADGITLAEALARADANLDEIRPPSLERIDEALAELGAKAPPHPSSAQVERIYGLANELAGTAGVFGLTGLGRAAYSLCELLDGMKGPGGWNAGAVTVHLDGLRLLRAEDGGALPPEAVAAVLTGLDKVRARFAEGR